MRFRPLSRRHFLLAGTSALAAACVKPETAPAPRPAAAGRTLRVDVWHDTICPWCRIGLHNLGQVLDAWRGPPVELAIHPFLLEPDTPPEGHDLRAHLSAKYGVSADQMFQRVTQAGARYGVTFAWDRVRVGPATVRSHALIAWAPAAKQRAVLDRIHDAYFLEGANLGEVEVLAAIAQAAGLDAAAAREAVQDRARIQRIRSEAAAASASKIDGVPHFRFGTRELHGAQGPEALRAALEALAAG